MLFAHAHLSFVSVWGSLARPGSLFAKSSCVRIGHSVCFLTATLSFQRGDWK